jgi:hypothetical protein
LYNFIFNFFGAINFDACGDCDLWHCW